MRERQIYALLLGAPKCGTSSLFNWLSAHPRVAGTKPKETFGFFDSGHPLSAGAMVFRGAANEHRPRTSPAEWLRAITAPKSNPRVFLEATTHNLYHPEAIEAARRLLPDFRAIVLLRRPADRVLSSYLYSRNNLSRVRPTFGFAKYVECLLRGDSRRIEEAVRHPRSRYVLSRELSHSTYVDHLTRWRDAVGRDRLGVWISEELFESPRDVVARIMDWLEVTPYSEDEFLPKSRNVTRAVGVRWAHRVVRLVSPYVPRGALRGAVRQAYFRLQGAASREMVEDFTEPLSRLDEYFDEPNRRLFDFLGQEVPCWSEPRTGGTPSDSEKMAERT